MQERGAHRMPEPRRPLERAGIIYFATMSMDVDVYAAGGPPQAVDRNGYVCAVDRNGYAATSTQQHWHVWFTVSKHTMLDGGACVLCVVHGSSSPASAGCGGLWYVPQYD
jgi:hypothetical protein